VSLNDGGREIVARAGDKGNLPGLVRTRLKREPNGGKDGDE
jgi:hypothetical protein